MAEEIADIINHPQMDKDLHIRQKNREERWFAVARTATKPENMQGFHEDNMLFIVDEASGVADDIMEAIQGTLPGVNNKLVACGNPTRASGFFYDCFTSAAGVMGPSNGQFGG